METTFAEILEMRRKLDAALVEKTGRDLASGFTVEMSSWYDGCISFQNAYHKEIEKRYCVGGGHKETPQEAFDSAMEAINAVVMPSVDDEIKALQGKIDALKS